MVFIYIYSAVLFLMIFCTSVSAQSELYNIHHFNNDNGLVQNSIKGIELDRKGYLWFATEMGVVRYDGNNFKFYDQTNSPELKSDRILSVGLMKDGNMFAEIEGKNYYCIDVNGNLQLIQENAQQKKLLPSFSISEIPAIYQRCRLKYERGLVPKWALPDFRLISRSLLNSLVYVNGNYYYFNENRELITVDTSLVTFRKINITGQLCLPISNKNYDLIPVSLIKNNEDLYVRWGEYTYTLSFLNNDTVSGERILYVGDIANITCLLKIPDQNAFVLGTMSDGFYIFQKQLFSTLTLKDVESNIFYAQAPYGSDGALTKKGVLSSHKYIPIPPHDFTSESILKTAKGFYYLNRFKDEWGSGVVQLDSQLHEVSYIRRKNLHVTCFRQLKDGSIWLSAKDHLLGTIEKDHIKWIDFQNSLPQGFVITSFIEASDNELWIAGNKGLANVNFTNNTVRLIPELIDVDVRCLYADKKGTIWIGTYGKGYYAWYKERLTAMPMDDNHFIATTHTFIEDNSGNVWITTNRGLFQAQMADLYEYLNGQRQPVYYYYYDKNDGFLTNEFNGGCNPSGIKLNNGMFSLPSIKGLIQFHPDSIKPIFPARDIYIDAIAGDTTIFYTDNASLNIPNSINHLQFFVSSPYLGNSLNQSIEYRLNKDGNNGAWYKVPKTGNIQFSKLPTGNYCLLVRKKAGFGKDNYITKGVAFSVAPYFYETWLCRLLLLAFLPALIYSILRLRILFLTQQKMKLEYEVSEKTKEQKALIINLEANVLELEQAQKELHLNKLFKEELAMIIAHDLQSPLRFISSATYRLYQTLIKKEYYEAQILGLELSKSSRSTYSFVVDFTFWLSSLSGNFHLQSDKVNLHNLLVEISPYFTELVKRRRNELVIVIDESLYVYTDFQLLKIILRNIIDNANKHTRGGMIRITGNANHSTAFIYISDDGGGMKEDVLKKIQSQIKPELNHTDQEGKLHGHGYRFISHFSSLLNINLEIESKWGQGTTVKLTNLKV